ncbi:hypothetical protein Tco_0754738 [Tanacetum coccineum]
MKLTLENKEHFLSEKEAIFLLLTGIGDDIYSIVDACKTANELWIAIERLQQGESLERTRFKDQSFLGICAPQSELVSKEDSDPEQDQRDKDMQKNLALLAKYHEAKRVKDYTYHKEKMMMCKQAEKGVPLQAEQANWLADTDEEIDEHELEAHYSLMASNSGVPTRRNHST